MADIITPNYYEAMKISKMTFYDEQDIISAAKKLQTYGAKNIVIKGNHDGNKDIVRDYVLLEDGYDFWIDYPYIDTSHINGTGDTLSACIISEIAKGKSIKESICIASEYTYQCISNIINVGHKYGPINHWTKYRE